MTCIRTQLAAGLTGLFLCLTVLPAQAQGKKVLEQLPKACAKNGAKVCGARIGTNGTAAAFYSRGAVYKQTVLKNVDLAIVKYKIAVSHPPKRKDLRRLIELRGLTAPKPWPKTTAHSLTAANFDNIRITKYSPDLPPLPIPTNNIYLYRGMGLNEAGLRNVLQNGLRVADTGTMSNAIDVQTRLYAMGTAPVTSDILRDMHVAQTNLTTQAQETMHFATLNSYEDGKLPVVVTVRGLRQVKTGYQIEREDIAAENLVEVSILINGPKYGPVWCKVTLAADGTSFVFTPYQRADGRLNDEFSTVQN